VVMVWGLGSASREDLLAVIGLLQRQVTAVEARAVAAEAQAAELAAAMSG
jgi:transposase